MSMAPTDGGLWAISSVATISCEMLLHDAADGLNGIMRVSERYIG